MTLLFQPGASPEAVRELTGGRGAGLILGTAGGQTLPDSLT